MRSLPIPLLCGLAALLVAASASAQGSTGVPSLSRPSYAFLHELAGPAYLTLRPDGLGPALSDASDADGGSLDATIAGPILELYWNSPDIDGDLTVGPSDVGLLVQDLQGAYRFRSDLNRDGDLNLTDACILADVLEIDCR